MLGGVFFNSKIHWGIVKMIQFNHVNIGYENGKEVLTDLSFYIHSGESVGIIGTNGTGKSTLLSTIAGLVDRLQGDMMVNGLDMTKKNLHLIRKKMGFVFQDPEVQLFSNSVYDDIAFGPRNYGYNEQEVERMVQHTLNLIEGEELKRKAPYMLSGGQKNMSAIATALVMNPDVLLMDEPTAALDPKARRKLIALLNRLTVTKVLTTHDLDFVFDTCERTIVLYNGNIVADGITSDILTDEVRLLQWGLELPLSLQGRKIFCINMNK